MKNLSIALNVVLLVAVGVLYYLHFSKSSGVSADANDSTAVALKAELPEIRSVSGAVAYINYDSLTEKYQFFKDGVRNLENNYRAKEAEFEKKKAALQTAMENYQQLAPTMTDAQRAQNEEALLREQNNLMQLGEKLRDVLKDQEEAFNRTFLSNIDDYLKELSKKKNYSYVFTYSKGGPAHIVFANDSLEITKEVISGLNANYKIKKAK
ncbi:MAG: OmpH family outer membrane protein [Cytophagaceae bacterium]|nr:OmpH family outer membrane protein [Cytophagaceae bacterium]